MVTGSNPNADMIDDTTNATCSSLCPRFSPSRSVLTLHPKFRRLQDRVPRRDLLPVLLRLWPTRAVRAAHVNHLRRRLVRSHAPQELAQRHRPVHDQGRPDPHRILHPRNGACPLAPSSRSLLMTPGAPRAEHGHALPPAQPLVHRILGRLRRPARLAAPAQRGPLRPRPSAHVRRLPPGRLHARVLAHPYNRNRFVTVNGVPSIGQYVMVGSGAIETQPMLAATVLPASSTADYKTTGTATAVGAKATTGNSGAGKVAVGALAALVGVMAVGLVV